MERDQSPTRVTDLLHLILSVAGARAKPSKSPALMVSMELEPLTLIGKRLDPSIVATLEEGLAPHARIVARDLVG
jgi:hypothetical protein